MRIAGIVPESVVDGPGFRYVTFVSGCLHDCKGCHGADLQDFNYGHEISVAEILNDIAKYNQIDSYSLSGGDPMFSARACAELCRQIKERFNFNDIYCYTGFTIEEILSGKVLHGIELLRAVDFLVDGRFMIEKRDLSLAFRGSSNQRIIDVKRTLSTGHIHCVDFKNGVMYDVFSSTNTCIA